MFKIVCYMNGEIVTEIDEKHLEEALLYAEILFNTGYSKVEVYDGEMNLIETF